MTSSPLPLAVASVSLAELFSGKDIRDMDQIIKGRLHLPEYQRPYRWSSEQVLQLAGDLARHQKDMSAPDYYLGSLILHQSCDESSDACWLNIIDGQQRITSVGILCALANISPLPNLSYRAPESLQRIRENMTALKGATLVRPDLERINVTLVVTRNEDDAYRFFETQNSGGVRLSGIDIAKAHHLRAVVNLSCQDDYARRWERLGNLEPVVDCLMRGRHWQSLAWRDLASKTRKSKVWNKQVIQELATDTAEDPRDFAYQLSVDDQMGNGLRPLSGLRNYDLRQPLNAGCNSIHYLENFNHLLHRYCPNKLIDETCTDAWKTLYVALVARSDASPFLRKLFDAALVLYVSRFGDSKLEESGLWLFRAVYSLRLSNAKAVKEISVQKLAHDTPILDWIACSYTHDQLVTRLRAFLYDIQIDNLDRTNSKKRQHVDAVCKVLGLQLTEAEATPADIVKLFDQELSRAIEQRCKEHA